MTLPDPKPGLVIRYDYLWERQAAAGLDQGKDRPACLLAAIEATAQRRFVVILPITHSPPTGDTVAIEIPMVVRTAIGLDEQPCWIVVSEHNVDDWPNAGLQPLPGRPGRFSYGFIPPGLFRRVKETFLELARKGRSAPVRR